MKVILDTKEDWFAELKYAVKNEPHNILTMSVRVKSFVDDTKASHLQLGYIFKGVAYVVHQVTPKNETENNNEGNFLESLKVYCKKEGVNILRGHIE